jgi:hypothetical protein
MKSANPLSSLLARWRHEPAPDAGFAEGVWLRIDDASSRPGRRPIMAELLSFSKALPLAAAFAVMAGIGAGVLANRAEATDRFAAMYARSIDPLQMSALPAGPAALHHHP